MSNYFLNFPPQQNICPPNVPLKSLGFGNYVSDCSACSNTLPSNDCSNGYPVNYYPITSKSGISTVDLLYSIYCSYQTSCLPIFLNQVAIYNNPPSTPYPIPANYETPNAIGYIGPKNIFIFRHAEKTKKSSTIAEYHIDQNGVSRALQMITYINNLCEQGYPISYIVVSNPAPFTASDSSMRPVQTASFAASILNIPVFCFNGSCDPAGNTAQTLFCLNDPAYLPNPDTPISTPTPSPSINKYTSSNLFNLPYNPFNRQNVLIVTEHTSIQELYLNIAAAAYKVDRIERYVPPSNTVTPQYNNLYCSVYKMLYNYCSYSTYHGTSHGGTSNGNYEYNQFKYTSSSVKGDYMYRAPPIPSNFYFAQSTQANIGTTDQTPAYNIFNLCPYWNTDCFDLQINFMSNTSGKFVFSVSQQPIETCFPSCNLEVFMYQVPSTPGMSGYSYMDTSLNINEKLCETPATRRIIDFLTLEPDIALYQIPPI